MKTENIFFIALSAGLIYFLYKRNRPTDTPHTVPPGADTSDVPDTNVQVNPGGNTLQVVTNPITQPQYNQAPQQYNIIDYLTQG